MAKPAKRARRKTKRSAKPRVFIGCSSEARPFVEVLASKLNDFSEAHPWFISPVFSSMQATLTDLLAATVVYDFGVFILTPDDLVISRKKQSHAVRDNVLFELGLFLGALGTSRTIGIMQQSPDKNLKIPADLFGINLPQFTAGDQNAIFAGVTAVLPAIRRKIEKEGLRHGFVSLVTQWGFDEQAHKFSISIRASQAFRLLNEFEGEGFVLVIRRANPQIPVVADTCIAASGIRILSKIDTGQADIEVGSFGCLGDLKKTDTIDSYLLLIPKGVSLQGMGTLGEMFDAGCRYLDRVSWTMESDGGQKPV